MDRKEQERQQKLLEKFGTMIDDDRTNQPFPIELTYTPNVPYKHYIAWYNPYSFIVQELDGGHKTLMGTADYVRPSDFTRQMLHADEKITLILSAAHADLHMKWYRADLSRIFDEAKKTKYSMSKGNILFTSYAININGIYYNLAHIDMFTRLMKTKKLAIGQESGSRLPSIVLKPEGMDDIYMLLLPLCSVDTRRFKFTGNIDLQRLKP